MILKNLIQELNTIIPRASDYDETNVTGVGYSGGQIIFECGQEELESALETKKEDDKYIAEQDKKILEQEDKNDQLKTRINELETILDNFKLDGGGTASDLLARVERAEKSEENYRLTAQHLKGVYDDLVLDHKKLNTRKNKASVTRCVYTGKLIAEFNGVKYFMEEKK